MIKFKQNQFILLVLGILIVGMVVGMVAVNMKQITTSKAATNENFQSGSHPAVNYEDSNGEIGTPQPTTVGWGGCFDKCRKGGGGFLACLVGCL